MGRGRHYRRWKRLLERAQALIYREGWAARLAYALGLQGRLAADVRKLSVAAPCPAPPLRLAFVSDVHAGPLTHPRLVQEAFERVASFEPDVLLLGGDYASLHHRFLDGFLRALARVRPPLGTFAVLGNHDLWLDDVAIVRALGEAGVEVLVNSSRRLAKPFDAYVLVGLDEPATGAPDLEAAAPPANAIRLLLAHSPLALRLLDGFAFHVAFMGHTHGGQIALPGGIPIVLPFGSGERRFAGGTFAPDGSRPHLLVSRGLGMSDVPVRLFARSEVHLWTLEPRSPDPLIR